VRGWRSPHRSACRAADKSRPMGGGGYPRSGRGLVSRSLRPRTRQSRSSICSTRKVGNVHPPDVRQQLERAVSVLVSGHPSSLAPRVADRARKKSFARRASARINSSMKDRALQSSRACAIEMKAMEKGSGNGLASDAEVRFARRNRPAQMDLLSVVQFQRISPRTTIPNRRYPSCAFGSAAVEMVAHTRDLFRHFAQSRSRT